MPSRIRSRSYGMKPGGQRTQFNTLTKKTTYFSGQSAETSSDYSEDVVGNFGNENPLFLRKLRADPLVVNGSRVTGPYQNSYSNVIPWLYGPGSLTHSILGLPSLSYLITEALARANPASDPDFDALNFGWELREFPRMLKSLGELFRRGYVFQSLTGLDIGFRFGWKPLMSDLRTLLGVQEAVERRLQKLKRAKFGFQTQLGSWSSLVEPRSQNWANDIKGTRFVQTELTAWAYISFVNDGNINFGNDPATQQLAFDLAFSTKLSAATIWNSFPWTWLIDYFSNVGRFLEVHRGGYPVKVSTVSLMRHQKSSFTDVPSTSGSLLRYSGGYSTLETKERYISYNPSAFLALAPGIGPGQLANLASLALAFMGRNPEVQRRTRVRPPSWYRKVTQAQNQVKAYGKAHIKLR